MNIEIKNNNEVCLKNYKEDFLNFIDVGELTVKAYNTGIKSFIQYLKDNDITQPTRNDIIAFREDLREEHSVATINSYLIAIRSFFKYLEYNGIYKNIAINVKSLKDTTIHKRKSLTQDQIELILNNCKDLREKTIFLLTLCCGLRVNEVVNIRLQDFKEMKDKVILYVLGKGRDYKQDYVIVDDSVFALIKEYLKEYNIKDYLFVSSSNHNNGGKLNTCTIRRVINSLFERVGIKEKELTAHSLRHSYATMAIENGADIREVSKALRHSNIVVTERYIHDINTINNSCSNIVSQKILGVNLQK